MANVWSILAWLRQSMGWNLQRHQKQFQSRLSFSHWKHFFGSQYALSMYRGCTGLIAHKGRKLLPYCGYGCHIPLTWCTLIYAVLHRLFLVISICSLSQDHVLHTNQVHYRFPSIVPHPHVFLPRCIWMTKYTTACWWPEILTRSRQYGITSVLKNVRRQAARLT